MNRHVDYAGPSYPSAGRLSRRVVLGAAAVALPAAAAGAALAVWVMNAPAVPRSSLARLHAGMTVQQVTGLLGTPDQASVEPDGSRTWTYSRMTWAYLTIHFDPNGTVSSFDHDE